MPIRPILHKLLCPALILAAGWLMGCSGGGGGSTAPPTPIPVISSFTASPASVLSGQPSTLAWTVNGATSLSIDQGIGPVTGLATKSVSPVASTTYTLTATNSGGSATAAATVTVLPAPPTITSFNASPATITVGASATLSWSASGATSLSLDQGIGSVTGQTSRGVSPTATATYTLTATNAGGSSTASATVTVLPLPPLISSFTASPGSVIAGTPVTLAWSVAGATSLSLDQGIGSVTGQASTTVKPKSATTYTLTATGPGGAVTRTATATFATLTITLDQGLPPTQLFHDGQPDALGLWDVPDMHMSIIQESDNSYLVWVTGHIGTSYGSIGRLSTTDFLHYANAGPGTPAQARPVMIPSCPNGDASCSRNYDADYIGANVVLRASNGTDLIMFYEAGIQYAAGEYNVMALARSSDNGLTWVRQGPVLSGPEPMPASTQGLTGQPGISEPGAVVANGYIYMIFQYIPNYSSEPEFPSVVQIARAPVASDGAPGTWMKFYNGTWSEPGLAGLADTLFGSVPGADTDTSVCTRPVQMWPVWSTYLNAYVLLFVANQGWYFSTSTDLVTWAPPKNFMAMPIFHDCEPTEMNYILVTPGNKPGEIGQTGYVLYSHTDVKGTGCPAGFFPHFLRARSFTFGKTP
jgi:hypothetical protein